ncbi:MAG: EamA family transporter, partial [Gemmatimonadales bacterium]
AFDLTDRDALLGNGAIVLVAFLWAASILHIRGHAWQSTPFDLTGPPGAEWTGRFVALLLFAAIPGTALAYWATAMASRDLPAIVTALGLLATPVVGVVVATLWLGEALTPSLVAAIVLILGGIAVGAAEPPTPVARTSGTYGSSPARGRGWPRTSR